MLRIKVCGITEQTNAASVASASPDFMGFVFYPLSKRYVGDNPSPALFSSIPPGIIKTGVFVNEEALKIIETVHKYKLDIVQLHGNEPAGYCRSLKEAGVKIIKAFATVSGFDFNILRTYKDACDYFLFDSAIDSRGGSGLKFDWKIMNKYCGDKPFFLAGGIDLPDTLMIKHIRHNSFFAVDINSRFETSPGIKDHRKVGKFIKFIRE